VNVARSFDILATSLSVLHNYFDKTTKLFSDVDLPKFLDFTATSFFPCSNYCVFCVFLIEINNLILNN